jgi:histidinol-phosphate aminotransferase
MELTPYRVQQSTMGIKLNQNESPFDLPQEIKSEAIMRLERSAWNRYPSLMAEELVGAIARYTDFDPAGIIVGNGSNELIQALFSATCSSGDKALVVSPGFSIYPLMAKIAGVDLIDVPLNADFTFNVPEIIERSKEAKLIMLASPNNPTGTYLTRDEIASIAAQFGNLFVVDEAYYEFSGISAQGIIPQQQNVVILRTFSKACGLAGIRIGYVLANPDFAEQLKKSKLPFSVGIMQQVVGEVLLDHSEVITKVAEEIVKRREALFSALQKEDVVNPIPSKANFILFEVTGKSARSIYEEMLEQGVLLRWFDNPRLKSMLRVTIGTAEENKRFLVCLRDILSRA